MSMLLGGLAVLISQLGQPPQIAADFSIRAGTAFTVNASTANRSSESGTPRWYLLEPEISENNSYRFRSRALSTLDNRWSWSGSDAPMVAAPGTHRIALTVMQPGGKTESWPDGFNPEILQPASLQPLAIIVREADDAPGRMTELLGIPFVETPRRMPGLGHPTDLRLSVNCAGLAIYGRRRLGSRLPYMTPPALRRYTTLIASYSGEAPLATINLAVRRGDLLHFGFQVAVLLEDRGRIGILDPEDMVIHAYHAGVQELPYSQLPYRDLPFTIRRWQ